MPKGIAVTDHAVLRWLERVQGVDIEAIRRRIWKTCEGAIKAGATCVRAGGVRYEFANRTVVTVAPGNPLPGKTSRDAAQRKIVRPLPSAQEFKAGEG